MASYIDNWKNRVIKNEGSFKQIAINQMCEDFITYLNNYYISYYLEHYFKSDITGKCTVTDINNINASGDEKYITTLPDTKLQIGDVVSFDAKHFVNKYWLITSEENLAVYSHKKFIIKPCNIMLNLLNTDGELLRIPVYGENTTLYNIGIVRKESGKISYGDTIEKVTMGAEIAKQCAYRGLRYLLSVNGEAIAYEVTYLDATKNGLITMQSSENKLAPEDDLENLIAFNWVKNPRDKISFDNIIKGEDIIEGSATYSIFSDNDPSIEDFNFEVDIPKYATVEKISNNSCIVRGIKAKEWVVLSAKSTSGTNLTKNILIKRGE